MKRIAIFQNDLDVGGIQKALTNLLRNFDYENYHVDLYLSVKKSFWDLDFPQALNIIYLPPLPRICSFIPFDSAKKLAHFDFSGCEEYDVAIDFNSYQFSCALGALTVPAKKRIMWIHNDVSIKLNNEWKYRVLWNNFKGKFKYFDEFVCVSRGIIEPFQRSSGIYDKKYTVIPNTVDTGEIFSKAEEDAVFDIDESKVNFVALGRLCHQKAFDVMLEVFRKASEQRDDLHLYIIGDGEKRFSLEYQRDSLGLTDKVTFLGQQTNPFKYMKKMDAFISTSRYEGQGINIMEAKALGLPLYCTKNLELYNEDLVGYEDITDAVCRVQKLRSPVQRDPLSSYNSEVMARFLHLVDSGIAEDLRKTVHIIALHLGVGGVEKAIINMANVFAERYNVEIRSVYKIPGSPAFPLDERVHVTYLLDDTPNRQEWKLAVKSLDFPALLRESFRSMKVLISKKRAVIHAIRSVKDGILLTTRHEDNVELSRFGSDNVFKIAQLHHDHGFERKYVRGFKSRYGRIDVLALLTPQLVEEAAAIMKGHNSHTKLVYMPNFLTQFPQLDLSAEREKTVLAAGRFTEVKRFGLLIEQFIALHDKAPDWKLKILGDGEDRSLFEAMISAANAQSYILLPGKKDSFEVESEMRHASIYAMTSRSEGFPFVLMEAQSCALPIIAFDVRVGPGFFVRSGENGFLIPDGDRSQFEERMLELMHNASLRQAMGQKALEGVQQFSKENVANMWYSVIENEKQQIH